MLADINTAPGQPDSSSPGSFARRGDALYFAASSPLVGRELFVADRATGVRLVLDLVPGTSDANPTDLLAWGSGLVFLADLGTGHRPHFYDLTTRTLRNLMNRPGRASGVSALTVSGGRLFFAANDGVGGADLWVAASPDSQAQPVADIRVDGAATFAAMLPFGSGVAMVVDDGVHGYELWLSDGTASGTRLVRDLNPGSAWGAYNIPPVVFGGEVYFVGDDGATGGELYASDCNNLRLVADLVSGPRAHSPSRCWWPATAWRSSRATCSPGALWSATAPRRFGCRHAAAAHDRPQRLGAIRLRQGRRAGVVLRHRRQLARGALGQRWHRGGHGVAHHCAAVQPAADARRGRRQGRVRGE